MLCAVWEILEEPIEIDIGRHLTVVYFLFNYLLFCHTSGKQRRVWASSCCKVASTKIPPFFDLPMILVIRTAVLTAGTRQSMNIAAKCTLFFTAAKGARSCSYSTVQ